MAGNIARALFMLAALAATAVCSLAQDKEQPPEGSAPKPFHSPKTDNFTLPNGMRATIAHYGLIPKVNVELVLNGGGITESNDKQGVARVMGELLKEGTETRSADQISAETASFGGAISVRIFPDQIVIHGEGLSDGVERLIALIADVGLHPKLPESEVARLKKDQLRLVAIAKSTPRTMAAQEFLKIVYGDNGYGRAVPDEKTLESVTAEDIKAYYSRHFVPSNARLYVSGVFDQNLRKAIETAFSSWPKGDPPKIPEIKAQTKRTLALVDRPGAQQSTIYMGVPVITPGNKDYIPLEVTDSILGGSFMSRITSNIREQKGYTYSPFSTIETNMENSVWAQHADVTTKFTGASLTEIFGEIDRLRKQPPPEKELSGIQNGMAGLFILRNSSRQGIIGLLRFVDVHHLPSNYLDTYISNMYAVKAPEVQGMMEKYIDPAKMTIVVVGDKSQVESQVSSFKLGQ
jgi:predicted Zn-dependent peptidase